MIGSSKSLCISLDRNLKKNNADNLCIHNRKLTSEMVLLCLWDAENIPHLPLSCLFAGSMYSLPSPSSSSVQCVVDYMLHLVITPMKDGILDILHERDFFYAIVLLWLSYGLFGLRETEGYFRNISICIYDVAIRAQSLTKSWAMSTKKFVGISVSEL